MRRSLITIAGAACCAWLIGFAFMLIEFHWAFGFIGNGLIRASARRAMFWVAMLPVAIITVQSLLHRSKRIVVHAVVLSVVCFLAALAAETTYLLHLAGHEGLRRPFGRSAPVSQVLPILLTSLHAPFALLVGGTMSVRSLEMAARRRDAELNANHLETRLSEARARLLRSQLHPHFLFNALNSVAALIRHDPGGAAEMLNRLARFYAIAASTEGRRFVSLEEELTFVRQYLDIEQIRFGPRLDASLDVPPRLLSAEVPTLILQPLAENAIKHGIGRNPGPGRIMISAAANGPSLHLVVEDNGVLDTEHSTEGVGLTNTRERLRQLYGDRAAVTIHADDAVTRVIVTIPFDRGAAA